MGGNAGIRGYIIQTIIAVLEAIDEDVKWETITLEPTDESEKVDIRLKYPDNTIKLYQVKSSQNLIRYSQAEKWCNELKEYSPNAETHELSLIGNVDSKLSNTDEIEGVIIADIKPLNIQMLKDQASTKIDRYYESKNKSKVSSKIRELIVLALTSKFATSSIVGHEIHKSEFDKLLSNWISDIEKQIETNPFASLAPPIKMGGNPINKRIAKKILDLIGWNQFSEDFSVTGFNERTGEDETHSIDFYGDIEGKLKEDSGDFLMVKSFHNQTYPKISKDKVINYLYDLDIILEDFQKNRFIPLPSYDNTDIYSILFWLTTDNEDLSTDYIHQIKNHFTQKLLNEEIIYLVIDNKKANFLISSVVTATNYREDLPVKFLYPITESNKSIDKIGGRGLKLPPQFINSSILPIVKEDKNKISILLFCSDSYSDNTLKKLIWLMLSLTSGFGNEYRIYFPDYNEQEDKHSAQKIIRSFRDDFLDEKVFISKYESINAEALDNLPNTKVITSKNETYVEERSDTHQSLNKLNEAFEKLLPYGDLLRPFLKTDAINANDIKFFLEKKGIFYKYANKEKLIDIMTSLLFSPKELEDFKTYIEIKERTTKTTEVLYKIKNHRPLDEAVKQIKVDIDELTEGLNIAIVNQDNILFEPTERVNEYRLSFLTELKDPTESLLVNTQIGKSEVIIKLQDDNLIIVTENTISREDKLLANRIVKRVKKDFQRINLIEEEQIKVLFSSFKTNSERVNFLLSFTNTASSTLIQNADIQSIKFKFDEKSIVPEKYQDKMDKDLVINYDGKGLRTLQELSEDNAKDLIYLEEMKIIYEFEYLNVKKGKYKVTFNFSNALKNKPIYDGVFKSEPYLIKSNSVKGLANIKSLEQALSQEIENLKISKLKEFNIIE